MTKALPCTFLVCCWLLPPAASPGVPPPSGRVASSDICVPPPSGRIASFPVPTITRPVPLTADTTTPPITLVPTAPTAPLTLRIQPDTAFHHHPNVRLEWQLIVNGILAKKGRTEIFQLAATRPTYVHLPLRLPPGPEEAFLKVTIHTPARPPAKLPAYPLLTRRLLLRHWQGDHSIPPTGELTFTDTLDIFTITSANTQIQFDKQTGWLLHYEIGQTGAHDGPAAASILLEDSAELQPLLWQPPIQPHLQLFSTSTGTQLVIVRAEYTLPEAGFLLHLSYTINASGEMLVGQSMEIDTTHAPTPAVSPLTHFGMRLALPQGLDSITWYGLVSPADTDSIPAIHRIPVTAGRESASPFADVRWLSITGANGKGLQLIADSSLLRIAAIRGIDSVGQRTFLEIDAHQPSPQHPLPAGTINYFFKISPVFPDQSAKIPPAHAR